MPPDDDPRWVTLFIADETTFQGSGNKIYPSGGSRASM